jgi:hypothetical protein
MQAAPLPRNWRLDSFVMMDPQALKNLNIFNELISLTI